MRLFPARHWSAALVRHIPAGPIRLGHAVLWPGAARHGPRRCRLQPAGAGGATLRGQLVAAARRSGSGFPAARVGSATPAADISLTCPRVGSTGLAITIRPDQAERGAASRVPPTRRRSFSRFTVAGCDARNGASGQPRHWNGAHWPCPRHLTDTTALPRRSLRRSTLQSAFGLGNEVRRAWYRLKPADRR
jgi:hypothetical protein